MRMRAFAACIAGALVAASISAGSSGAASSNVTVSMTVASATSLSTAGCASDTPAVTAFGTVLPGTSNVTSSDCVVTFGSSNDTSQLRLGQQDRRGKAMWRPGDGPVDSGFGGGDGSLRDTGMTVHAASGSNNSGVALQSDGKIIVAGRSGNDVRVRRYFPDGSLDNTFGTLGTRDVTTCLLPSLAGVVVLSDDSIVVGGVENCAGDGFAIKLDPNGTPDPSYDDDGYADLPIGGQDLRDIAVQADDKVLIAGGGNHVWRVTTTGQPDLTWAGDGRAEVAFGVATDIRGVEVMSDQKVILSAERNGDITIAKLTSSGSLDLGFAGGDGWESIPVTTSGRNIAASPDGSFYIAGYEQVAKFTSAGLVDNGFGTSGIVDLNAEFGNAGSYHSVVVQPDGKPVFVGQAQPGATDDASVARLLPDGTPDITFDGDGERSYAIDGAGFNDEINRAIWADDGDLIAFGHSGNVAMLLRLEGATVNDYAAGAQDWDQGTNAFAACLRSVAAGATADWTANATCPATDGAYWNAVPTSSVKVAHAAVSGTTGATVNLRFGVRTATAQAKGMYVAPIAFEVLAPDA